MRASMADSQENPQDGSFELYDLRVEVTAPEGGSIYCGARRGDHFELRGEMLHLPPGQGFSIYSLAAVLPLLAAKQRATDGNDWMTTDAEIACPDPIAARGSGSPASAAAAFSTPRPPRCRSTMTDASPMPRIKLAPDHEISRVIRGGWQLATDHSQGRGADPVGDMVAFAEAGITTFDCADIYTGVEELVGRFRLRYRELHGPEGLARVKVHTKFVPDRDVLETITKAHVQGVIEQSLRRLHMERLDLVQFHWWDYAAPRWLDTAHWLDELRQAGKINKVSLTNFDTDHLVTFVSAGIPITSLQLQYSLLDRRPEKRMVGAAAGHGVALLCYGTVAGGFLGDAWLGRPEPAGALENRSLTKYKLIIDDFGGWALFQLLLRTLRGIADRHGVDIATIASAAVLAKPGVAAVIVGARTRDHLAANLAIGQVKLDADDLKAIEAVLAGARPLEGDVYNLERGSRHGAVMKYNLNRGAA